MNSSKLFLLTAIFIFAFAGTTAADGYVKKKDNKVMHLTLEQAVQIPELLYQMHRQLDDGFLNSGKSEYIVSVHYHDIIVVISGSYHDWVVFFRFHHTVKKFIRSNMR